MALVAALTESAAAAIEAVDVKSITHDVVEQRRTALRDSIKQLAAAKASQAGAGLTTSVVVSRGR
jgi:hypothetical protein